MGRARSGLALLLPGVVAFCAVGCFYGLDDVVDKRGDAGGSEGGGSGGADASAGTGAQDGSVGGAPSVCDDCISAGTCVAAPAVPAGWSPLAVLDQATPVTTPCPASYSAEQTFMMDPADTGCTACVCADPAPQSVCTLRYFSDAACTDDVAGANVNLGCFVTGLPGGSARVTAEPGIVLCEANGSTAPNPPAFKHYIRACTAPAPVASAQNAACLPSASAQFHTACVLANDFGDRACPPGYPVKAQYSTTFDDNRSCTCTCNPGGCTGGSMEYCADSACSSGCVQYPSETCAPGGFGYSKVVTAGAAPTCAPGAPTSSGALVPHDVTVACCVTP